MARRKKITNLGEAMAPYVPMVTGFVNGTIDYDTFEGEFYAMYLNDTTPWSHDIFETLDDFFFDVDNCVDEPWVPDPELKEITPDELRERAIALLREGGYEV